MTLERLDREKVHLLREHDDDGGGGGAYCGEMCFGMGERGTYDRAKANCHSCISMVQLKELRERNTLDKFVREVNRDQHGSKP